MEIDIKETLPASAVEDVARAHSADARGLTAAIESLREKVQAGRYLSEFAGLEVLQTQLWSHFPCSVAKSFPDLNRYSDVLPYDHCRVMLGGSDGEPWKRAGYINASLIPDKSKGHWQYIVAQGPLPHTAVSFWQMVVELGVHVVVMLTDFVEGKRTKCDPYFSPNAGSSVTFGPYEVSTISVEDVAPGMLRRRLVVAVATCRGSQTANATYEVNHFQMVDWPDHGVPASPVSLLLLTALVRQLRTDNEAVAFGKGPAPTVVHCSAGIGRSGVFCVIDTVLRRLLASAGDSTASRNAVDVSEIVAHMRAHRGGMVQTSDQYRFCHTALLMLLEEVGSIVSRSFSN